MSSWWLWLVQWLHGCIPVWNNYAIGLLWSIPWVYTMFKSFLYSFNIFHFVTVTWSLASGCFWLALIKVDHALKLTGHFEGILGLGRPQESSQNPASEAAGVHVPGFLDRANIRRFSMCFNYKAPGVLGFNTPVHQNQLSSAGQAHWSLKFHSATLGQKQLRAVCRCFSFFSGSSLKKVITCLLVWLLWALSGIFFGGSPHHFFCLQVSDGPVSHSYKVTKCIAAWGHPMHPSVQNLAQQLWCDCIYLSPLIGHMGKVAHQCQFCCNTSNQAQSNLFEIYPPKKKGVGMARWNFMKFLNSRTLPLLHWSFKRCTVLRNSILSAALFLQIRRECESTE